MWKQSCLSALPEPRTTPFSPLQRIACPDVVIHPALPIACTTVLPDCWHAAAASRRTPLPPTDFDTLCAACLQYSLPSSYDVLPLMARMAAGLVAQGKGSAVALLSLQWHVPQELKQQAKGGFCSV